MSAICTGMYYACALLTTGGVQCWGANNFGQLGDGTSVMRATPAYAVGLTSGVTDIACGGSTTCALQGTAMKCWGSNYKGGLGDGTTTDRNVPQGVQNMGGGVVGISVSSLGHTCSILSPQMAVYCWGVNENGQLGDRFAFTQDQFMQYLWTPGSGNVKVIPTGSTVSKVLATWSNTCVVANDAVYCWGSNTAGQMGDNTTTSRPTASPVLGLGSMSASLEAQAPFVRTLTAPARAAGALVSFSLYMSHGCAILSSACLCCDCVAPSLLALTPRLQLAVELCCAGVRTTAAS